MKNILTLIDKEWAELIRDRFVLLTVLLPTVLFPVILLGVMLGLGTKMDEPPSNIPEAWLHLPLLSGLSPAQVGMAMMVLYFINLSLVVPLIAPMTIAVHSIIGEKQSGSLEPLLATPIETMELFLGKVLAASLPGVAMGWLNYLLMILVVGWRAPALLSRVVLAPATMLLLLLGTPILAVLSVSLGVIISSRMNDVRAAQQLGGIVVLPVVGLAITQMVGKIILGPVMIMVLLLLLLLADALLIRLGVDRFGRETVLTRWR
ncbi:MAG: ABC transporter permease subunit [Firmicutes bacterium]|nr:ABC transporter permease subunit [Bacillota bacterium]MCL5038751.1 ABC transporter permease subunit [Bacillota bacterium]